MEPIDEEAGARLAELYPEVESGGGPCDVTPYIESDLGRLREDGAWEFVKPLFCQILGTTRPSFACTQSSLPPLSSAGAEGECGQGGGPVRLLLPRLPLRGGRGGRRRLRAPRHGARPRLLSFHLPPLADQSRLCICMPRVGCDALCAVCVAATERTKGNARRWRRRREGEWARQP